MTLPPENFIVVTDEILLLEDGGPLWPLPPNQAIADGVMDLQSHFLGYLTFEAQRNALLVSGSRTFNSGLATLSSWSVRSLVQQTPSYNSDRSPVTMDLEDWFALAHHQANIIARACCILYPSPPVLATGGRKNEPSEEN